MRQDANPGSLVRSLLSSRVRLPAARRPFCSREGREPRPASRRAPAPVSSRLRPGWGRVAALLPPPHPAQAVAASCGSSARDPSLGRQKRHGTPPLPPWAISGCGGCSRNPRGEAAGPSPGGGPLAAGGTPRALGRGGARMAGAGCSVSTPRHTRVSFAETGQFPPGSAAGRAHPLPIVPAGRPALPRRRFLVPAPIPHQPSAGRRVPGPRGAPSRPAGAPEPAGLLGAGNAPPAPAGRKGRDLRNPGTPRPARTHLGLPGGPGTLRPTRRSAPSRAPSAQKGWTHRPPGPRPLRPPRTPARVPRKRALYLKPQPRQRPRPPPRSARTDYKGLDPDGPPSQPTSARCSPCCPMVRRCGRGLCGRGGPTVTVSEGWARRLCPRNR